MHNIVSQLYKCSFVLHFCLTWPLTTCLLFYLYSTACTVVIYWWTGLKHLKILDCGLVFPNQPQHESLGTLQQVLKFRSTCGLWVTTCCSLNPTLLVSNKPVIKSAFWGTYEWQTNTSYICTYCHTIWVCSFNHSAIEFQIHFNLATWTSTTCGNQNLLITESIQMICYSVISTGNNQR